MKTRHKVLLALMAAVTVIMVVIQGGVAYRYHHPPLTPMPPSGYALTDILFLNTIFYFLPAYLGVWLLWAIGVKIALWLKYRDR